MLHKIKENLKGESKTNRRSKMKIEKQNYTKNNTKAVLNK